MSEFPLLVGPRQAVILTTEESVWELRQLSYVRRPRNGEPRPEIPSIGGRLADWTPQFHRGLSVVHVDGVLRVRILPEKGPKGGKGVLTGEAELFEVVLCP